jgi:hypothetical protein
MPSGAAAQASLSPVMAVQSLGLNDAAAVFVQLLLLLCRDTMNKSCVKLLNGQRTSF